MSVTLDHVALLGAASSVHLQRWALALHERGLRVSLLSQHREGALPLPPEIACHWLPHRGSAGYFLNARALRALLRRLAPDLLHAHYASGYGSSAMLARFRPTLLSVWGSDVYDFPYESRLKGWLLRRNLRAADALASTSHAMAAQVRRLLPGWQAPIAVTPFGVDTERFAPAATPAERAVLTIGTVKALAPKYGVDTLLRAFALLGEAVPPARVVLVGDGPQRPALEALAAELGIAHRVQFAGAVPHAEVPGWLRQFDVYVAASRLDSESFGVAVVEAMACGVPVVVSDAGGLPEVAEDCGLVVPRDDPPALARALAGLLGDAARRTALGRAGRARALAEYAWPRCVDRMLECQRAVVAARR